MGDGGSRASETPVAAPARWQRQQGEALPQPESSAIYPADNPSQGPWRRAPVQPPHLSASSNTTYSTLCNFRFISTATCTNRPGVAMILPGVQWPSHPPPGPVPPATWGQTPALTPAPHTHMSGFSCRAANWSSILGRGEEGSWGTEQAL